VRDFHCRCQRVQGITGISGSNGAQGAQGIQGVQGTQGDNVSSGSLLVTASFANTNITFTKGDATTFNLPGFAITGSNTFVADQIVNGKLTISSSNNSYLQFTSPNNQTGSGQIFFGSLGPYIQTYSDSLPDNQGLQLVAGISGSFALATRYGGQNAKIDLDAMADQTNPATTRGRLQVKSNGQIDLTGLGGAINLSGSGTIIQGLTYPGTDGTNGQVLTTNGSGTLTFTSVSGSSINTGSFATTGSNTFTGVNTFNERTNLQGINVYTGSASGIYIGDRTTFAPTTAGNIPGNQHTVVGQGALNSFGNGDLNAAFGPNALSLLISGSSNLAMGAFAGLALVNGNTNVFIGDQAGNGMKGGDNNFFLGSSAGNNFRTGSSIITITYPCVSLC